MEPAPESCQVKAADGTEIVFDRYRGPIHDAALIICPGFFQSRKTPTFRRLAAILSRYCSVLCMDFRGHGDSTGNYTFSALEGQDLEAVYRWAQERYDKVGVLGFSLGAATAINFAAKVSDIRTLVAVSPPTSFEEIEFKFWTTESLQTGLGVLEPGTGCMPGNPLLQKERPIDNIGRLSKVPVMLVHGTKDRIISSSHSERLYEAAGEPKRLLILEGGGHAEEMFLRIPEEFLPPIQDWLRTTLMGQTILAGALKHTEGYFRTGTGVSYYYQRWGDPKGAAPIVLVHDAGDHSTRSVDTANWLAHNGWSVYAVDLPGHGRSSGPRGHVRKFEEYMDCVHHLCRHAMQESGAKPVLAGQGFGALVCVSCAAEDSGAVESLALSCPLWGLVKDLPLWQQWLASAASVFMPALPFPLFDAKPELLTRDPQAVFRYKTDALLCRTVSARFYTELKKRLAAVPAMLQNLHVPVLVLQASEDKVAPPHVSRLLFEKVPTARKRFNLYEDFQHDLFNELGKERVLIDMQDWLRHRRVAVR